MYSVWAVAGVFFIWLGVLTFWIWKQGNFLKSLFPKTGGRDIRRKFEEIVKEVGNFRLDLDKVKKDLEEVKIEGLGHIQKVELLRFNPYGDTGGDQSFVLVLLDDRGNGKVITSLHARGGTRIFAKDVILGKSGKYRFSEEEERVIKKALTR